MRNKGIFTKTISLVGTILVWIPVLLTIGTSIAGSIACGRFLFDYLMPAELFFFALAGALLLLWAAQRAGAYKRLVLLGLAAEVIFLISSITIASVSGLASGEMEPEGWIWALVVVSIILYSFAVLELCIAGVLLTKNLYKNEKAA